MTEISTKLSKLLKLLQIITKEMNMTTDNTDSTETLVTATDPVVKTRKPRSQNKPKTADKLGLQASKKIDRLNVLRDRALEEAAARVNTRFDERIQELFDSLADDVKSFVTGLNKPVEDDTDTEVAAE